MEVELTDHGQASALQGRRKRPTNDRLDARWLVMLPGAVAAGPPGFAGRAWRSASRSVTRIEVEREQRLLRVYRI